MRAAPRALVSAVAVACLASCQPAPAPRDVRAHEDIRLPDDDTVVEALVPRNATLESLLRDQQLPAELSASLVDAVRGVFNPRELRADRTYRITKTIDGVFREFRYQIDADRFLRVVLRNRSAETPEFTVDVQPLEKTYAPAAAAIEITREQNSLVRAFDAIGENIQLPLALADVFGGEVDFNADLQLGDRIEVLFDRVVRNGEFAGYGDVKAAILVASGHTYTAIRYTGDDGKPGWYDEEGRSMRRQFLKSPLPFDPRVTSRFSLGRLHPVHGTVRPHFGVDYGAAEGTRVNASAAGVVESAGWAGEAGRMIKIRHAGGYETAYLHLSAIAPGIAPGARVDQGQFIGRVGSSGTATGPHLDYRILKSGKYVNPLTELAKMPPGEPIGAAAMPDFLHARDQLIGDLAARLQAAPAAAATPGGAAK